MFADDITINEKEAKQKGYTVVCGPYSRRKKIQMEWLKNVIRDMKGADIVLVDVVGGIEVWRHESEMDVYAKEQRMIVFRY